MTTSSPSLPALRRCRATTDEVRSTSPLADVWTGFACTARLYAWRSTEPTEPTENTDPEKYPVAFRLNPADLPELPVIPAIPPLRAKQGRARLTLSVLWLGGMRAGYVLSSFSAFGARTERPQAAVADHRHRTSERLDSAMSCRR